MTAAGRYFVGIEVPPDICGAALVEVQKRLEPHLQVKRWYAPEQLHLTTSFLGELSEEQVEAVVALLEKRVREHEPFELRLGHVGWFPRAKVVWCGVEGTGLKPLFDLQAATARDLSVVGAERFSHETYRPHITLGRLKSAQADFQPDKMNFADVLEDIAWRAEALHLYESVSNGANGPDYPKRFSFRLGSS